MYVLQSFSLQIPDRCSSTVKGHIEEYMLLRIPDLFVVYLSIQLWNEPPRHAPTSPQWCLSRGKYHKSPNVTNVHAVLSVAVDCGLGRGDRALSVWHKKKKTKTLRWEPQGLLWCQTPLLSQDSVNKSPLCFFKSQEKTACSVKCTRCLIMYLSTLMKLKDSNRGDGAAHLRHRKLDILSAGQTEGC